MEEIRDIKFNQSEDKDGVKYFAIEFYFKFKKAPFVLHLNTAMDGEQMFIVVLDMLRAWLD